jgi:hypothetical protein
VGVIGYGIFQRVVRGVIARWLGIGKNDGIKAASRRQEELRS